MASPKAFASVTHSSVTNGPESSAAIAASSASRASFLVANRRGAVSRPAIAVETTACASELSTASKTIGSILGSEHKVVAIPPSAINEYNVTFVVRSTFLMAG